MMDKHKPSDEMIKDLDNLLSKLKTWQLNDISKGPIYNNNHVKVLGYSLARYVVFTTQFFILLQLFDVQNKVKN